MIAILGTAFGFYAFVILFGFYASRTTLMKIAGIGFVLDVGLFVLLAGVFGGTGLERIGAAFASIAISLTILGYRHWVGYYQLSWAGLEKVTHWHADGVWMNSTRNPARVEAWTQSGATVTQSRSLFYWENPR